VRSMITVDFTAGKTRHPHDLSNGVEILLVIFYAHYVLLVPISLLRYSIW